MSDKLARQYNYNHGNAYLPPDDRLMAQLIVGHLPDVLGEPEREYDYTRVGTIGCFCEERLLRGDGDGLPGGENDTDPYLANLCQWRFVADSFMNPKEFSVCGENFVTDVARAIAFHGENNTLIEASYAATKDDAVAKLTPVSSQIQNLTDTYKTFYDTMSNGTFTNDDNGTTIESTYVGHVDYAGYGEININCADGVSICLKESWDDLFLLVDAELRQNCSDKRTSVMAADEVKEETHRNLTTSWLADQNQITVTDSAGTVWTLDSPKSAFDTLYATITQNSKGDGVLPASLGDDDGSWSDIYHMTLSDADLMSNALCVLNVDGETRGDIYKYNNTEYFCYEDEDEFKSKWRPLVESAYESARQEIASQVNDLYTAEQARMATEFQRAFSNSNSQYRKQVKSTFAAWEATDKARHLKEIDEARKKITEYYHYQFHRPEINVDRILFKLGEKVTEIGGEGFTYRSLVDDDGDGYPDLMSIDTETKFTLNVVATTLCELHETARKKIADSKRYFTRHNLEELNALETLINNQIESAQQKLMWDKNRDRLAVVEQSKATAKGLSGKLRANANNGILRVMTDSAGKGAEAEGNIRLQTQGMKILAAEELTGLKVEFAEKTQEAVEELAEHLASKMIMIRKHVQDLKDELNSRQMAHETKVLLKIAQTEEISANQLKSVVDTIDTHFKNLNLEGTNSTGIDFDPNKYYMFSTVNQS